MRLFTLGWPQFVVLGLGLCAIYVIMAIILIRDISEALVRLDLKRYEQEFGFEMGLMPGSPSDGPRDGWLGHRVRHTRRMDGPRRCQEWRRGLR